MKGQIQFGKLKLITPISKISKFSQKVKVVCECGNRTEIIYRNLAIGNTKSCGKCELFLFQKKKVTKFNHLELLTPINSLSSLGQNAKFKCKCGTITNQKLYNVIIGHTKSCGKCYNSIYQSWENSTKKFQFPIPPGLIFGIIYHSNIIINHNTRLDSFCPICGNKWTPLFKDVRRGVSLSCGCSYHRISTQQEQISKIIHKHGILVYLERSIGKLKYDIVVPSHKFCIEFHGLTWHSKPGKKQEDKQKYKNAIQNGYTMMVIYEDEWMTKSQQVSDIILNRLNLQQSIKLRPSECEIQNINSRQADEFYTQFHYIGGAQAKINIASIYNQKIIACMSFKRPTRQSKHDWELVRMAANPKFHIHGIWSKLLKVFKSKYDFQSIVSFSDNRLFTGKVYEKMRFKLDGEIRPDYYWVKGKHRYHKSRLRKRNHIKESQTESQLRISQGYHKIWDLGKKRWVLII